MQTASESAFVRRENIDAKLRHSVSSDAKATSDAAEKALGSAPLGKTFGDNASAGQNH